jgi:hypothetical protein
MMLLELAGGCKSGPTKVDITGKLLKDGQPLKVSNRGKVEIKFVTEGGTDENYSSRSTNVDDQGNFAIKGITAGKYRIIVRQLDPYIPGSTKDLLEGAFTLNSPIVRDVETNDQVIEIDLAKEPK